MWRVIYLLQEIYIDYNSAFSLFDNADLHFFYKWGNIFSYVITFIANNLKNPFKFAFWSQKFIFYNNRYLLATDALAIVVSLKISEKTIKSTQKDDSFGRLDIASRPFHFSFNMMQHTNSCKQSADNYDSTCLLIPVKYGFLYKKVD